MFNEQLEEILIELYQKVSDGSLLFLAECIPFN